MRIFFSILIAVFLPAVLAAQEGDAPVKPAVLIADDLFITSDRVLVARGNVEAFQGKSRLTASEIRYDRSTGSLIVEGPIVLTDAGRNTVLASAAELNGDLQTGLLNGARLVLDQQLQLASVQMERVSPRYDQLYKTAVTSCQVCEDGKPPLWQIRAKRVIHDKEARQLYFDQAQFRIRNVTVAYFPRLRLPDPTLERATGFLIPSLRKTTELGTGIKIPYFIVIDDHRDVTVTPYISSRTKTLELRYRQAFVNGRIDFNTAVSRDDERPGETRGYVFGYGAFELPDDFRLTFDVEITSDDAYLKDYGFSGKDRLDSEVNIQRARRDEFISGSVIGLKSLRDGEDNATLPTVVIDGVYEQRFFPTLTGGEFRLNARAHSHYRYSDDDIIGRDISRFSIDSTWLRGWTLPGGVRADATLSLAGDVFDITQDSTVPQTQTQLTPGGALAFRYPLTRQNQNGVTHFLEPVAQIGWTGGDRLNIPNEESTRVEFDGGNLLSLSRFPAPDRRERGTVGAYGINWSRFDPEGLETSVTLGQVFRNITDDSFSASSGLTGGTSDFLFAGQLKSPEGWAVSARTLFNDSFDFTKAELRGYYGNKRSRVSGTYLWLDEDEDLGTLRSISEISLNGSHRVDRHWTANADWRFDLADDRAASAGFGLNYTNECVSVGLSVARRFTTSTSLEPSTSVGFNIGLRGFSARKGSETYARTCKS
ncbi:LPS assembly protein LptD [uncultured Roseobacter sp.]|uniref:LPS-assembly protein LptD n=1 Tax=uncultured Roseobacter sp. TaxID=114847 RepID=UPI00263157BB|nr:LPS assembly protein LptD [uncultured Roseobacter sp.]